MGKQLTLDCKRRGRLFDLRASRIDWVQVAPDCERITAYGDGATVVIELVPCFEEDSAASVKWGDVDDDPWEHSASHAATWRLAWAEGGWAPGEDPWAQ